MRKRMFALAIFAALHVIPIVAAETSVSYTAAASGQAIVDECLQPPTDCTASLVLPGFNPALGTLKAVFFQGSMSVNMLLLANDLMPGQTVSGTYYGTASFFQAPTPVALGYSVAAPFSGAA